MAEEVSQTLNTMHDAQAVLCEDVSHALRAKAACAYREDAETYPVQHRVVRRLTPLECERLQGFPDHWTDLGEWTDSKGKRHKDADSPRYKALGNSIALPPWKWLLKRQLRAGRHNGEFVRWNRWFPADLGAAERTRNVPMGQRD